MGQAIRTHAIPLALLLEACAGPANPLVTFTSTPSESSSDDDNAPPVTDHAALSSADGDTLDGQATLRVTIAGPGSIASTPPGLVCQSTSCVGNFSRGTAVTLTAKPGSGTALAAWGGACSGAGECRTTLADDVAVTATLSRITGTFSGPFTHGMFDMGCQFENKGTMTVAFLDDGTALASVVQVTGMEGRDLDGCGLVVIETGQSSKPAPTTGSGAELTGVWSVVFPDLLPLAMPFKATVRGNTLAGSWTCPTCTGSYTLTRE
jgi:hypothetical protein